MDAKGRCFDNIIMERFLRNLKQDNLSIGYMPPKERRGIYNSGKKYELLKSTQNPHFWVI